jgi:small subunit ribosomal protein S6
MNIYENVLILNQSLSEDDLKAAITKISDLIVASGGEILKTDHWGKRRLAYEMNKQRMGVYVLLLFKAPAATIRKLEDYFKVFDPVMKFMIIRLSGKQIAALPPEVLGVPVTPQEISSPVEPTIEG